MSGIKKRNYKNLTIPDNAEKIGVYAIHNKANDKYYIGSSVNMKSRLELHRNMILLGGINHKMIADINSPDDILNFEFLILESFENNTITDDYLRKVEYKYLMIYDKDITGYNTNTPFIHSYSKELLTCKIISNNYDRVSVTLPKGSKERIKSCNKSINGLINELVEEWLQEQEEPDQEDNNECPFA